MPRAQGEIILVVEDDERVRHVSVDALRGLGYTVVQASDGNQGLAALAIQPRVDLLFTDVVMPDLNGRQLADQARAARPGLKVLFTTGYTRNAIVHNGTLDADVDFLPKPFTVEQLARKVRWVLDQPEAVASGRSRCRSAAVAARLAFGRASRYARLSRTGMKLEASSTRAGRRGFARRRILRLMRTVRSG